MNDKSLIYDDPSNELIIIPKATMDRLLKTKSPGEAIAVYNFYCYTAKWQKTNQPKCAIKYVMKGLGWGEKKVRAAKSELKNIGLIDDITIRKDGKIDGWFIKIKYIANHHIGNNQPCGCNKGVEAGGTNALSTINLNALSTSKGVTKVTLAEKNSAGTIPEETSFTEEEFKLDDDPEEKFKDSVIQWIVEITTAAKDRSLSEKATQPFFIPRNDSAKYLVKIKQYMHELSNGSFLRTHKFSKAFLQHIDMPSMKIFHGLTDAALMKLTEQAVSNYLTARNNPEKHDFISRDRKIDLGVFFYEFNEKNGVLGVSHFLQYFNAEPEEANAITRKEQMLQTIYKKDLSKMYSLVYIHYEDFSDEEMLRMVKSILSLCRWWNRNEERLLLVHKGKLKIRFPNGLETFIEHHLARFIASNRFEHAISLFPEKKHWKAFLDFIYDETEIDLEAEVKVEKKKKSSVSLKEIERRMEAD